MSDREIKMLKKMVNERDRKERERNIIIEGWRAETGDLKEKVKKFFSEKIFNGEIKAA